MSNRKRKNLNKRVADLEKGQLDAMKVVKDYIFGSQALSEQLSY